MVIQKIIYVYNFSVIKQLNISIRLNLIIFVILEHI